MICDLWIFSGKVYHPESPHAQSLFLFPIVFGINLLLSMSVANISARFVEMAET